MNWYKETNICENNFNIKLKNIIKSNPFFHKLFDLYNISLDVIDNNLKFHIADLKGKNAKSIDDDIYFDSELFKKYDFFKRGLHFVVHELIHWLTRQKEKNCYFSDPEEIQAFIFGIAYEIKNGVPVEDITKLYLPIIEKHFNNKGKALTLYKDFHSKATNIRKEFS